MLIFDIDLDMETGLFRESLKSGNREISKNRTTKLEIKGVKILRRQT